MGEGPTWCFIAAHVAQKDGCISMSTSNGKKVAVLIYKHRHGEDVTAHKTADGAERQVYAYMNLWMSEVPPSKVSAIKKAIRYKKLRDACDLWREAFDSNFDGIEMFEIHENVVVQP